MSIYYRSSHHIGLFQRAGTRQPPGAVLHSSHELGELLQGFVHDVSTINIILALLLSLLFQRVWQRVQRGVGRRQTVETQVFFAMQQMQQ